MTISKTKVVLIRQALRGALEYIGDEKGECLVCGGGTFDPATGLEYHRECPCRKVRQALKVLEGCK